MEKTIVNLTGRICPLHKTELVYEGKHLLVCQNKVQTKNGSVNCPHREYTTLLNPDEIVRKQRASTVLDRLR